MENQAIALIYSKYPVGWNDSALFRLPDGGKVGAFSTVPGNANAYFSGPIRPGESERTVSLVLNAMAACNPKLADGADDDSFIGRALHAGFFPPSPDGKRPPPRNYRRISCISVKPSALYGTAWPVQRPKLDWMNGLLDVLASVRVHDMDPETSERVLPLIVVRRDLEPGKICIGLHPTLTAAALNGMAFGKGENRRVLFKGRNSVIPLDERRCLHGDFAKHLHARLCDKALPGKTRERNLDNLRDEVRGELDRQADAEAKARMDAELAAEPDPAAREVLTKAWTKKMAAAKRQRLCLWRRNLAKFAVQLKKLESDGYPAWNLTFEGQGRLRETIAIARTSETELVEEERGNVAAVEAEAQPILATAKTSTKRPWKARFKIRFERSRFFSTPPRSCNGSKIRIIEAVRRGTASGTNFGTVALEPMSLPLDR
ncbi:MAG: hypothetical protein LBR80_12950 [Deltaproteobacteria bacterium]|jgi:hypothetical protein|nr:hypothetical protein [Deltaproteobacteria bacterium]